MSLFTACSDDDDPDYSKVIEEEIAGNYKGTLDYGWHNMSRG